MTTALLTAMLAASQTHAASSQDLLNAAAQAYGNTAVSNTSDAAYPRQAARAYRNGYSQAGYGSSSGGYPGGGASDKAARSCPATSA